MDRDENTPGRVEDVSAVPESKPEVGEPDRGDNQDVAAEKIYPTDPTGADPT